ncbi:hypothetical protein PO461_07880 [Enterobacter asburiae]|uniref:hypothetical protein n=1 Tax=Enterobacter asburiae TaxID=61645 RepID=UPI002FF92DCB
MSKITKEQAQSVSDLKAGYTLGHADVAILNELARIALASLEAEAVYQVYGNNDDTWSDVDEEEMIRLSSDGEDTRTLYTAPPAPVDNIHPLLEFAREYIESWDLGMAGDSGLLESAKRAIADSAIQQPAPFVLPVQHWEELCRQNPDMSIGDAIIRAAWWNHCAAMLNGEKS